MTTYVNKEGYKTWASIRSPNEDDKIEALLAPACILIQEYLGFTVTIDETTLEVLPERKEYKYRFKHKWDTEFLLPDWESSIVAISLFYTKDPSNTLGLMIPELSDGDYYIDESLGLVTINQNRVSPSMGVSIQYDTTKKLDEAIILATYMLVDYWRNKDFESQVSQSSGQYVSRTPVRVLPKHIESLLNSKRYL